MRKLILITITLFGSISLYGQSWEKGSMVVSLGYGAPNLGKSILKIYQGNPDYRVSGFGPTHAKFEYGVSNRIGLGLSFNLVNFGASWRDNSLVPFSYAIDVTGWSALLRMNHHFATGNRVDPYWGFGIGYRNTTWTFTSEDPDFNFSASTNPFGMEITIGLRVYITDNIGLYAETGMAKSIAQGGLAFKF